MRSIHINIFTPWTRSFSRIASVSLLLQGNGVLVIDGVLGSVFVPRLDPFEEMSSFRCVFKQQAHQAVFCFESVEKLTILVVFEVDVQFLVPYDTSGANNVDQFKEESVAYEIIHQSNCAVQISVLPLGRVWVGYVESSDGGVDDLVGGLWDVTFDFVLIFGG